MSHSYLIIKTEWVPEWTKQNVPTYPLARFNNDGTEIIIDDAHPTSTFLKWLGHADDAESTLNFMLENSIKVGKEEFLYMQKDPLSSWHVQEDVE